MQKDDIISVVAAGTVFTLFMFVSWWCYSVGSYWASAFWFYLATVTDPEKARDGMFH